MRAEEHHLSPLASHILLPVRQIMALFAYMAQLQTVGASKRAEEKAISCSPLKAALSLQCRKGKPEDNNKKETKK